MKHNIQLFILVLFSINSGHSQDNNLELVSPAGEDAVISYFHQFPDSPDGKKMVFTIFKPEKMMDIVVKDLNTNEFFTINTVKGKERHTGTYAIWTDNQTLLYNEHKTYKIYHHNIYTGELKVYNGGDLSDYSEANNAVLYKSTKEEKEEKGVYILDLNIKETKRLISMEDILPLQEKMNTNIPIEGWNFDHPYWSPDGSKIMFQIKAKVKSKGGVTKKRDSYLFFADKDGKNIQYFGEKPMHVQWWDNNSVFGFETANDSNHQLNLYNFEGKIIEEHIAGHGNHGSVSGNRQWIVTDTWYQTDPISVYLYKKDETAPRKTLFSQPAVVNGKNFWEVHSHAHPAFSRDGKRVYFNGMARDGKSKVWCYDLESIIENP